MNYDLDSIGLTDEKTETDLLHIEQYVKSCASFIMNCKTPMSIAVLGSWGTGKSSFMEMVKAELGKENLGKKAVIVDFNTWQFSRIGEDKLFIPLLTHATYEAQTMSWLRSDRGPRNLISFPPACLGTERRQGH